MSFRPILQHGRRRGLKSRAGFSRRDVLRRGVGAAALAAVGAGMGGIGCGLRGGSDVSLTAGDATPMRPRGPRVAVIGAGFAGLACADTLARGGADVIVLEATSRPGGRVLSDRKFIKGKPVECGAEFIGSNHPVWLGYAERFAIELAPAVEYEGDEPIVIGGRLIRGEEADRLYEEIDIVLAEMIDLARPIDPIRPWRSPNAAALDRTSFIEFLLARQMSADVRELLAMITEADNGVPASQCSLLAYLAMIAGGGFSDYFEISETHRAAGGNDALASALAKSLGKRVRYNCAAVGIHRTKSHAVINTSQGDALECDAVVLAVPPTVWRKIAFDSPLNGRIPQMGRNVKLITRVQSPVWEQDGLTPEAISNGLINLTWVSCENDPGLPKSFTMFSGGRQADALRGLDPKLRMQQAVESLRAVYPKLGSVTVGERFVDWPGMGWALASYSFPAPGQVTRYGPILVDGVNDGRATLRLAGEHTSYAFIGYMEGALQSGIRVATSILSQHRPATSAPQPAPAAMLEDQ